MAEANVRPAVSLLLKRVWSLVQRVAKGVTWLTAFVASVSVIVLWFPAAYETVNWRDVEYARLASLHAGYNGSYVDETLGRPTLVKTVEAPRELAQNLYIERDYVVMTIEDSSRQVLLYSVLSCSRDFQPEFLSPIRSVVSLQDRPLSEAERIPNISVDQGLNDRRLIYMPARTVSSLNQMVEIGIQSTSNAARNQSWFVGVNGACANTSKVSDGSVVGLTDVSVPIVDEFRRTTAANFYAETAYGVGASLSEEGQLTLGDEAAPTDVYTGVHATPFVFDLPVAFGREGTTRTF